MKRWFLALVFGVVVVCGVAHADDDAPQVDENGDLIVAEAKPPDPLANMKLIASYALTALGAAYIGFAVVKTFSSSMSYPQLRMMLTNFLRTNPYQLIAIGKKSEGTIAEPIVAALKVGGMLGPLDVKTIQQATLPTFDASAKTTIGKFGGVMTKCKLAATAALGGAIVGFTAGRYLPAVFGALAGLGFLRLFLYKNDLESNMMRARAEVLPEVDAAVAAGRYHAPPPQS